MGRSIPSFSQQILQIEKLNLSSFNKMLPTRKDKQDFDKVFDNVRLYTSYLGNASNPTPHESKLMGPLFHNYKQLLQITKEDNVIDERTLGYELTSLLNTKSEGKILFYRFSKEMAGL